MTSRCLTQFRALTTRCAKSITSNFLESYTTRVFQYRLCSNIQCGSNHEFTLEKNKAENVVLEGVFVSDDKKQLTIKWHGGEISSFRASWLRMFCQCPKCQDFTVSSRIFPIEKMPLDVTLKSAIKAGDKTLNILWNEEEHEGILNAEYLKEHDDSGKKLRKKLDDIKMKFYTDLVVPEISWNEIQGSETALLRWMKHINERGLCLVKDVPAVNGSIKEVVSQISPILVTSYGEVYDVITMEKPTNIAYTDKDLPLHMDLQNYESPPGIQFLHCLRFDKEIKGSETVFVDLFHVVEEFRKQYPDEFRILTNANFSFNRIHYERDHPIHMTINRPIIQVNKEDEVICMNWNTGYIGPSCMPEDQIDTALRAYKLLGRSVAEFPYKIEVRLKPGELICFNNRRIGHGRKARLGNGNTGSRHLQGCYITMGEFKSKLHIVSRRLGDCFPVKRMGDMDWI